MIKASSEYFHEDMLRQIYLEKYLLILIKFSCKKIKS